MIVQVKNKVAATSKQVYAFAITHGLVPIVHYYVAHIIAEEMDFAIIKQAHVSAMAATWSQNANTCIANTTAPIAEHATREPVFAHARIQKCGADSGARLACAPVTAPMPVIATNTRANATARLEQQAKIAGRRTGGSSLLRVPLALLVWLVQA